MLIGDGCIYIGRRARDSVRTERKAAAPPFAGLGVPVRAALGNRHRHRPGGRRARRRGRRGLPQLGGLRRPLRLRAFDADAGAHDRSHRGRIHPADGDIGGLHRCLRRSPARRRAGTARVARDLLFPDSTRDVATALVDAPNLHADGDGDRDHDDRGHGDAHRLRNARDSRRREPDRRSGQRHSDAGRVSRRGVARRRGVAFVGAGYRRRGRLHSRPVLRAVRREPDRRRPVVRPADRALARHPFWVRPGILGAAAGVRGRHAGRCRGNHRRRCRHSARLVAQAPRRRSPRRARRGGCGRCRQPAVRLPRDRAEHDLFDQRVRGRADRSRGAPRRRVYRLHPDRASHVPEDSGTVPRNSGRGRGRLPARAARHALRAWNGDHHPGWHRLPEGDRRGRFLLGRHRFRGAEDLRRVSPGGLDGRAVQRHGIRRIVRDRADALHRGHQSPAQAHGRHPRCRGAAQDQRVP